MLSTTSGANDSLSSTTNNESFSFPSEKDIEAYNNAYNKYGFSTGKGLYCKGSVLTDFYILSEDFKKIRIVIFENDEIQFSHEIETYILPKVISWKYLGRHSINRQTLNLSNEDEVVAECQLVSPQELRNVAEKYLASILAKNKL